MSPGELVGRKIAGKFVIEAFVGAGGMGAVYRARRVDLDTVVAVKVLHASFANEPSFAARFKREARAASRIDHPNSMRLLDFGQEPDGLLYMAMEYLEGKNLHAIIAKDGPLESARIEHLMRQILAALAAAHDLSILHRDLKPENIIVLRKADDEGHVTELVKVCDFGIAKFAAAGTSIVPPSEKLTVEGTMIGTPAYMSPEQARALEVDARSDLYSVGVILYEAMTGRLPFVADTPLAMVLMHINHEPMPPSKLRADVDPRHETACLKALAKLPEARFQSAREMRAALAPAKAAGARAAAPAPLVPPTPAKGTLVLMPSESTSTPGMTAPTTGPSLRAVRGAAMATLMADSVRPGNRTALAVAALAVAIACVGGGLYLLKHRPVAAAGLGTPPVQPTPSAVQVEAPATAGLRAQPTVASPRLPPEGRPPEPPPVQAESALAAGAAATEPPRPGKSLVHGDLATTRARRSGPAASAAAGGPPAAASDAPAPPPPAPPPPTQPSSGPRVVVGGVSTTRIASADVRNGLPVARFTQCYRDGLAGQPPFGGMGKLHLDMSPSEVVGRFEGPSGFDSIGRCITRAAEDGMLRGLPASSASADVELSFRPE